MLNKTEAIKIVNEFLDVNLIKEKWFLDIKDHIKAIILYGSVANGTNRPDSDIDILFITPLDIEEKYSPGEYFCKYKREEINIVFRSIERLRELSNSARKDEFQREVFRDSEIIWEKDSEVKVLIGKLIS